MSSFALHAPSPASPTALEPGSLSSAPSLWMNAQDTGATQPAAFWDLEDAVAGLEAREGEQGMVSIYLLGPMSALVHGH